MKASRAVAEREYSGSAVDRAYRGFARRVVAEAFKDLRKGLVESGRESRRQRSSRLNLKSEVSQTLREINSPSFEIWSDVSDFDPEFVRSQAAVIVSQARKGFLAVREAKV